MTAAVAELAAVTGVAAACRALGVPRSSYYRRDSCPGPEPKLEPSRRPTPSRALCPEEKAEVRHVLNSERFCDQSPREVYATLLDEGIYYCHWRTMYRILGEHGEVHERRNQRRRPVSTKPELCATGPNQLWSWDITQVKGPRGICYHLYVLLDVFSRYVSGWMLADQESASLAEQLIAETCAKQGIRVDQLILHSDRGSAMRSKTVAQLLVDLGVTKSHSRPYTPTDNPYSEAQFKTLKYRPDYPKRFAGQAEAYGWAREFFHWYNHEHHHSGLGLLTPATVHYGRADQVYAERLQVLAAAQMAHPERFVRGQPLLPQLPEAVWINAPQEAHTDVASMGQEAEAPIASALDLTQQLVMLEPAFDQADDTMVLLPKFQRMLSQNR